MVNTVANKTREAEIKNLEKYIYHCDCRQHVRFDSLFNIIEFWEQDCSDEEVFHEKSVQFLSKKSKWEVYQDNILIRIYPAVWYYDVSLTRQIANNVSW